MVEENEKALAAEIVKFTLEKTRALQISKFNDNKWTQIYTTFTCPVSSTWLLFFSEKSVFCNKTLSQKY